MNGMHRVRLFLGVFIFVLASAFSPIAKPGAAQVHELSASQTSRDVYEVQITVLNISNINLTAGTYDLDFYLTFECKTKPCKNEPAWDILNAVTIDPIDQGTSKAFNIYDFRVKTKLIGRVDYTFYPFDYLHIDLYIEDKELGNDMLTYQYGFIKTDTQLFNPSGWTHKPEFDGGRTVPAVYEGYSDSAVYDRLNVWLFLVRDWRGAFMKTIFPAIIIVLVGMLSYILRVEDAKERLALTSSTLVAIVFYHISLISSVPAVGSFLDKFMVATYIAVFVSLVVSVVIMVYINNNKKRVADRIHHETRWMAPVLWILLMVYVFIFQLYIPYQKLIGG